MNKYLLIPMIVRCIDKDSSEYTYEQLPSASDIAVCLMNSDIEQENQALDLIVTGIVVPMWHNP